jgi:hypothetical protein
MSAFRDDCGRGMPPEAVRDLRANIAGHLAQLLANVGKCERCRAQYLALWHEQLAKLTCAQPEMVRVFVGDAIRQTARRIDDIDAESRRIARELLGGGQ